jgi:integrase
MSASNLNQKRVDAAEHETHPRFIRYAKTPGLILAVNKKQNTSKVQADLWRDWRLVKTVRHTLGRTDELSLRDARERAQEVVAQIKRGIDPNEPVRAAGDSPSVASMTVGELWEQYEARLRRRGRAEHTVAGFRCHLDRYISDWRDTQICDLRKSMCRERHEDLTERHGPYPANQVMRSLRAAYNYAVKMDDDDMLRANPVGGVEFHPERRREAVIEPDDLPGWWERTVALPNPLRQRMHQLGILSGLRPGTLVGLERDWIDLSARAIKIPWMKSGREFHLPLSAPMEMLVSEALTLSRMLYPDAAWLFPKRTIDGREIIPTKVWKERSLRSETGHILRHTYRTLAHAAGVSETDGRLLLDQRVPGISGVYIQERGLFDRLLAEQERVSKHILDTAEAR